MAEIEKGLPNTRTKLEIPSDEELQEEAYFAPFVLFVQKKSYKK